MRIERPVINSLQEANTIEFMLIWSSISLFYKMLAKEISGATNIFLGLRSPGQSMGSGSLLYEFEPQLWPFFAVTLDKFT